jgi:hypothetical protein
MPASFGSRSIRSLWHIDADATLMSNWSFEGVGRGMEFTEIELVLKEY